ncbi:MAG TPA: dTDP-4-dehydrorhamnose reductase [Thermoleophilaceae bacterium]|jgi:dTDP-4-dehydrorhamnose reductase
MKILVCGAGGMLGRDLVKACADAGHEVAGLARAELDVTDARAVRDAIAETQPETVLNCAAWTDVDGAEDHEADAQRVNGEGAGNVAAAAAGAGASVLYVSSDYVFDGSKAEPYVESDPTGPLSAYGRSKLAGERATAEANPRHFVVRSSWLFGSHGPNFVATMLRLGAEREELNVVDDQVGCPTWTGHLATGLLEIAASGDHGIRHLAGAGETSWCGFAREIFTRAGVDCDVRPITTAEYPLPATRPANSVLRSTRGFELPPWQEGLERYLSERKALAA